jgi:RNA polymerase sigma-70 factor (ECF subfamily)
VILVRQVREGEAAAIARFIERMDCVASILAARNARLGRPLRDEELSDLAQDTITAVLRKLDMFAGHASLETWVFHFCEHELMNAIRRKRRQPRPVADCDREMPRDQAVTHEREPTDFEDVYASLDRLAPEKAVVIRLKHFSGLTFPEIATQLEISTNTAKTRYYRGLEELRQLLRPRFMEGQP